MELAKSFKLINTFRNCILVPCIAYNGESKWTVCYEHIEYSGVEINFLSLNSKIIRNNFGGLPQGQTRWDLNCLKLPTVKNHYCNLSTNIFKNQIITMFEYIVPHSHEALDLLLKYVMIPQ